jgi:hypothetical protein
MMLIEFLTAFDFPQQTANIFAVYACDFRR